MTIAIIVYLLIAGVLTTLALIAERRLGYPLALVNITAIAGLVVLGIWGI